MSEPGASLPRQSVPDFSAEAALRYIRDYYRVPANLGTRVIADGRPGEIVGAVDAHLRIRLDGEESTGFWHPKWRMEYVSAAAPTEGTEEN